MNYAVLVPDKPIKYNFKILFDCAEPPETRTAQSVQFICVVYDNTNDFLTYSYLYTFDTKEVKLTGTNKYKRDSGCTPIRLRISENFIGVHCQNNNSNDEKISLYDLMFEYPIYQFLLDQEDTDFNLNSFSNDYIMLAVSGHNPKLYTITKDIYLDSSTRDLDQIKNIEIIFDYAEETSVKLGDVFLPGEEKPQEDKDWKFWIILWVCCAVILLIGVIVCYLKFKGNTITDFGGVEDKGYNSMSDKDRTSSNLQWHVRIILATMPSPPPNPEPPGAAPHSRPQTNRPGRSASPQPAHRRARPSPPATQSRDRAIRAASRYGRRSGHHPCGHSSQRRSRRPRSARNGWRLHCGSHRSCAKPNAARPRFQPPFPTQYVPDTFRFGPFQLLVLFSPVRPIPVALAV